MSPPPIPTDLESILTWLAAAVIAILIHETGHALASVARSGRIVTPLQERAAQLESIVDRAEAHGGTWNTQALARLDAARTTARDTLIVALGGPIASLIGGAALILAAISSPTGSGEDVLGTAGLASIVFALVALVPLRRPGNLVDSDGRRAVRAARALRRLRSDP